MIQLLWRVQDGQMGAYRDLVEAFSDWSSKNCLLLNTTKTKEMVVVVSQSSYRGRPSNMQTYRWVSIGCTWVCSWTNTDLLYKKGQRCLFFSGGWDHSMCLVTCWWCFMIYFSIFLLVTYLCPAGILFTPAGWCSRPTCQHHWIFSVQQNSSLLPRFCNKPQPLLARELWPCTLRWNPG